MRVDPKVTLFLCIFALSVMEKSLKFDTIAKIKVNSVLEIFVSLRYFIYIHMISEKQK